MGAPSQTGSADTEREILEIIRGQFEEKGYSFRIEPEKSFLPSFLEDFRPDAIASKDGMNVVIEVRNRQSSISEKSISKLKKLFEGQDSWQLHVVNVGSNDIERLPIEAVPTSAISDRLLEVRRLKDAGFNDAAMVMAWSLLEAALQSTSSATQARSRMPGTVVQTLAMNGYITPETEQKVRPLIQLRHRIVHGDMNARASADDVEAVLHAVEEAVATAST